MALCSVVGTAGCLLPSSTSSSHSPAARQNPAPLGAFRTRPSAGVIVRSSSAAHSRCREPQTLRRQARTPSSVGGRGVLSGPGRGLGRLGKAGTEFVASPLPFPLRAAAEEGGAEVADEDYDPDDVAVSDESVPDDILETLAASENLPPVATEPPEFADIAYTAVPSLVSPTLSSDGAALGGAEAWGAEDGAPPMPSEEEIRRMDLKLTLMDSLFGLERGIRASSEGRAEIAELVAQLEACNPTPYPAEDTVLLGGRWILAYTSFSELLPLLAASLLPLVKVGDIVQEVDTESMTIVNAVTFIGPLTSTTFEASAAFEVRSPKRLQIKFQEGSISPPRVEDVSGSPLPSSLDLFGQTLDLGSLTQALQPLQQAAMTVAQSLSGLPPLKFQLGSGGAQSWLLTTYLDEDIRVSRGDGGGLFVLIKEGSNLK